MPHRFLCHGLLLLLPECSFPLPFLLVDSLECLPSQVNFDVEQYCSACRQDWRAVDNVPLERDYALAFSDCR